MSTRYKATVTRRGIDVSAADIVVNWVASTSPPTNARDFVLDPGHTGAPG
jgi:hypothetical protein